MHKIVCLEKRVTDFEILQKSMKDVADCFDLVHFDSTLKALSFLTDNAADAVFLAKDSEETDMQVFVGILRKINNDLKIVLLSSNKADAYEAIQLELDGFLLKPATEENVSNMLLGLCEKLCSAKAKKRGRSKDIHMCTMPAFDMFVDGEPIVFGRDQGKELMALLVNAGGAIVNTEMIIKALWPGDEVGLKSRNRCRVLVNWLKKFLNELGLEGLFIAKYGQYYLNQKAYSCDVNELLRGDSMAGLCYNHHYMDGYNWAQERREYIEKWSKRYSL